MMNQTDKRKQRADAVGIEVLGEARDGHQRSGINRQTRVLQTDKADEQTNADGNAALERQRDGVENRLANVRQAQHDKDETLNKDRQQRDLPGVTHAQHNRVGEERIQTHARRQRERQVRHQSHARRADKGRNRGRQQDGSGVHARSGQDARIDRQDVSHGHKGGDARHDFRFNIGFVFAQLKNLLKHRFHSLLSYIPLTQKGEGWGIPPHTGRMRNLIKSGHSAF